MVPLQVVVAIAGLLGFVLRAFFPGFPLTDDQIVYIVVTLLGLIGVVVQVRFGVLRSLTGTDGWLRSKAFWILIAGALSLVVHSYLPSFPMMDVDIAAIIFWLLAQFGVNPEVRAKLAQIR